jgi:membrane-associated phospholipid phosphatase
MLDLLPLAAGLTGLAGLSSIPAIDIYVTERIYRLSTFHRFSTYFSTAILWLNFTGSLACLPASYTRYVYRYAVELGLINVGFKSLLDRPRPVDSWLTNKGEYPPVYAIRYTNCATLNQSFPSGHVATVYCTYHLLSVSDFPEAAQQLWVVLLGLTIFARMNLGAHHFSDCMWALLICHCAFRTN